MRTAMLERAPRPLLPAPAMHRDQCRYLPARLRQIKVALQRYTIMGRVGEGGTQFHDRLGHDDCSGAWRWHAASDLDRERLACSFAIEALQVMSKRDRRPDGWLPIWCPADTDKTTKTAWWGHDNIGGACMNATAQAPRSTIIINGARIELIDRGCGRPILFLHPHIGLDPSTPVLDMLAEGGRLLAP